MIRELKNSDISEILFNAQSFWDEIKGNDLLGKLNLAGFSNFLRKGFAAEELIGWGYEKEKLIAGLLFRTEYSFFTGKTILSEIFWWAAQEHRNSTISYRLIKHAEEFAVKNNIDSIIMACMEYPRPERLSQFYQKIGYKRIQLNFCKDL